MAKGRSHLIAKIGGYTFEKSRLIKRDKLTVSDVLMFVHNLTYGLTQVGREDLKVYFNGKPVYRNKSIIRENIGGAK